MTHGEKRELVEMLEEKDRRGPSAVFSDEEVELDGKMIKVFCVTLNPYAVDKSYVVGREILSRQSET